MCVLVCVCVLEAPGGINRNLRVVGLSCGNGGKRHPCAAELDWSSRCDTGFTPLSRFDLSGAFGHWVSRVCEKVAKSLQGEQQFGFETCHSKNVRPKCATDRSVAPPVRARGHVFNSHVESRKAMHVLRDLARYISPTLTSHRP